MHTNLLFHSSYFSLGGKIWKLGKFFDCRIAVYMKLAEIKSKFSSALEWVSEESERKLNERRKTFFFCGVKTFSTRTKITVLTFLFSSSSDFLNSHRRVNVLGYHFAQLMFTFFTFTTSFASCVCEFVMKSSPFYYRLDGE